VTYQPNISGVPDPSGLQLRVDGSLVTLGPAGIDLGASGRIIQTGAPGGLQIVFPNGTVLNVTPGWWSSQGKWYLNVDVPSTPSLEGLMGAIVPHSWLPALPNGGSMGAKPTATHQRYVDLYQKFGEAWRVTDNTTLFDYKPGTSTATFTVKTWPLEQAPCVVPEQKPATPVSVGVAEAACRGVTDKASRANCVFDVAITGNKGFAQTYVQSVRGRRGATTTLVSDDVNPTQVGEPSTFTAVVALITKGVKGPPTGTAQFIVDGVKVGAPVKLDAAGRASWEASRLKLGKHSVSAAYIPTPKSDFAPSVSDAVIHVVKRCLCDAVAAGHR
jgi:hypothetical protein